MKETNEFFTWAKSNNWRLELSTDKKQFPSEILQRYINIPNDYKIFYEQIDLCVGPIGTSWFLTEQDFSAIDTEGGISTTFAWNSIEKMSLESVADDEKLIQEVDDFWKLHLPIMYCVDGDYEYFAINISNGAVVNGYEPEFEEATEVAKSFSDFLDKIIKGKIVV